MGRLSTAYGESADTHPDVRTARLAARQHGLVTSRQLAAVGLTRNAIRRRVAKGRLHRVHPGVYVVGNPLLTREGRWIAAVMAAGPGAALSHPDAAALWDFYDGVGARVHVTAKRRRFVEGVIVHRVLHKNTIRDFLYRSKLPMPAEDEALAGQRDFWKLIEEAQVARKR